MSAAAVAHEAPAEADLGARHSSASNEHHTPHDVLVLVREVLGRIDLDPASCATANRAVRAARFFAKADNGLAQPWSGLVFLNPPGGYCDRDGHEVHRATKTRKACTGTGSCGLPPGHHHAGVGSACKRWWFKLATEYTAGSIDAAVWLGFSVESLTTTQRARPRGPDGHPLPTPLAFPICYPAERIAYVRGFDDASAASLTLFANDDLLGEGGDSPPHASYLAFLPPRVGTEQAIATFHDVFTRGLGAVVVPRTGAHHPCT